MTGAETSSRAGNGADALGADDDRPTGTTTKQLIEMHLPARDRARSRARLERARRKQVRRQFAAYRFTERPFAPGTGGIQYREDLIREADRLLEQGAQAWEIRARFIRPNALPSHYEGGDHR